MQSDIRHTCTLIILGAGGYLGSEVAGYFHRRPGWHIVGVFHRPPLHESCDHAVVRDIFTQEMTDLIPTEGRTILINAAYAFQSVGQGAPESRYQRLEQFVQVIMQRPSALCINISSMSAFANCRSDYGREKLFVEQMFARHRGINVRPGLVVSWQRPGSAFLHLIRMVRRTLVVPYLIGSNDGLFVCDLDAFLEGVDRLVGMRLNKSHTISFCYPARVRLLDVMRAIRHRFSLHRLLVPVPWQLASAVLFLKERFLGKGKVRLDSIRDFAFPATVASHRTFFARILQRRHGTKPPGTSQVCPDTDSFFTTLFPQRTTSRHGSNRPHSSTFET